MTRLSVALFMLVSLILTPLIGSATIVGVQFGGTVVSIDETTGAGAAVGPSGFGGLNSLAADGAGTLFSAQDLFGGSTQNLITINPTTGVGSSVSVLNFGAVNPDVRGLAFSSGGVLFAINNTGAAGGVNPDDLFTINPATGVGTLIGATGLTGLQGLDFSPTGALFGWDIGLGLVTINTSTGAATDVNTLVGAGADIQSIAFGPTGTLFGAREALFTIDSTTGVTTLVGSGGYGDVRGIDFAGTVSPVPEPSALHLLAIGLVGLGAANWTRRSRRSRG